MDDAGCDIVRIVGPLSSDHLAKAWRDCDAAILGLDSADASAIHAADQLQVISRYGVGYDNVDIRAAAERAIMVTITPAIEVSVAELTIGLMLALARNFGSSLHTQPVYGSGTMGRELAGACLGIIGMGRVGREVAQRATAFGMHVVYSAPRRLPPEVETMLAVEHRPLSDLLAASDVVTLHCALTPETRGIIGRAELDQLRRGALVINTARGALIDEEALADALRSGTLGGAALDVRANEEAHDDDPLLGVEGLLFTPHVGSRTSQAVERMARMAVANVLVVKMGNIPPGDIVTT